MQKPKIVYIAVDDDYELPFAMGDTMRELAEEIGVSTWDIWNCVKNRGRSTAPLIIHIVSRKLDLPLIWRTYSTLARTETFTT